MKIGKDIAITLLIDTDTNPKDNKARNDSKQQNPSSNENYLMERSMPMQDDAYLQQIQNMIDSTMAKGDSGTPLSRADVLATSNEKDYFNEIDKIFGEILAQEKRHSEPVNLTYTEDDYLKEVTSALKENLKEDPASLQEELFNSINELYPYLDKNFIRAVYDFKEDISVSYPLSKNIILLHRISFAQIDDLRQFVEIVLGYGYRVNVDEHKMIVDVIKEIYNQEGAILTNIFDIANQAKLLNGIYEGYTADIL